MPDLILLGSPDLIDEFEPEDNPADLFVMLFAGMIDLEARTVLYALLEGSLIADAEAVESLLRRVTDDGPAFYELDPLVRERLSLLDEDEIEQIASDWAECEPMEARELETSDLVDFLFQFAHLCQTADDDTGIFILTDN